MWVHVIHVSDGILPSDMATGDADQIEEERRLLYVACTRAREHLYVLHPLRYYVKGRRGDAHIYSQLTRFIPRELKVLFPARPPSSGRIPTQDHSLGPRRRHPEIDPRYLGIEYLQLREQYEGR